MNDLTKNAKSNLNFFQKSKERLRSQIKVEPGVVKLFEEQVERTPDTVAVVFEGQQLTYRELNNRANQLAHYLQKLGVKPEILVGICIERSLEMVVGLLGILKAGGAYVPLDPKYPKERLAFMLSDTQVSLLLTQRRSIDGLFEQEPRVVCLDTDGKFIAKESQENPVNELVPENLAYIIYTSGSTGKPKGVQITHANVWHYLKSINKVMQVQSNDVYLNTASFSFSSSVRQLIVPLSQGSKIILANYEQIRNPLNLFELIQQQDVTIFDTVQSVWHHGLQALENLDQVSAKVLLQSKLRLIVFSGGLLPCQLLKRLRSQLGNQPRIVNVYGQTETIGVCAYPIPAEFDREEGYVPVGYTFDHTQIYILDSNLQPVAQGEKGELHVAGKGLARGYLNRADLTSEQFIINPFSNDSTARLYKTGDVARYLADGSLEILGRLDHQVKIREMRIELGEIELVLEQHPGIRETVLIATDELSGDKRLIAYVVPELLSDGSSQKILTRELRNFLKEKLPEYMVPSSFMVLTALPLTPNGKVDRSALPAPDISSFQLDTEFIPLSNPTEEILVNIWADILGVERVGIHDNFFELGGHSLLATRVISRCRQAFSVEIPLLSLFENPTIAGLAVAINQSQIEPTEDEDISHLLAELERLSDEEVKQLLAQEMQSSSYGG